MSQEIQITALASMFNRDTLVQVLAHVAKSAPLTAEECKLLNVGSTDFWAELAEKVVQGDEQFEKWTWEFGLEWVQHNPESAQEELESLGKLETLKRDAIREWIDENRP